MYEIIERYWNGCEIVGTAETLEEAIKMAEAQYKTGEPLTEEESVEVWRGYKFCYMACGE